MARARLELFHVTRAYEELMRRYQRTLFNVCARYLGNDRDADDVCQEVMLKVLYGLKNFEGKSKFKTWLYSITYNECITQYRKERRKRRLLDALSLDPQEEASEEKSPAVEEVPGAWSAGWCTSIRSTGKSWYCALSPNWNFRKSPTSCIWV